MTKTLSLLADFLLERSRLVFFAVLLLVAALASGLAFLKFDNRPDAFFLENDQSVSEWTDFKQQYASDEFSFVVLTPASSDLAFIAALRTLTKDLFDIESVVRVTSLINVRSIRRDGEKLDVGGFLNEDLSDEALLDRIGTAKDHPYFGGLYVSRDGTDFGVMIETDPASTNEQKAILTDGIRAVLASETYAPLNGRAIGAPVLDTDVQRIVGAESGLFGALTMGIVLAGFAIAYRSLLGLVMPMLIAVPSILVTLGGMGHLGVPAGLLTPIIPSFLISVGLSSTVYLLTKFHALRRKGVENEAAIKTAFIEAGGPAILANATTAFALFAFSSSPIRPVQHVGVALGAGLIAALVLTLVMFPVLAKWTGWRITQTVAATGPKDNLVLQRIGNFVITFPKVCLGVFAVIVLFAVAGLTKLETDYYYLGTFKESTKIVRDYESAAAAIPIANTIEVVIDAGQQDAFQHPETLRALQKLTDAALAATSDYLEVKVYSLADVVKEISREVIGTYDIPNDSKTIAQLLLLFESSGTDELSRLTTPIYDQARLTFMVPAQPYSGYASTIEAIQSAAPALFAEAGLDDVTVTVTGVVPLWMRLSGFLTETQISSFLIAAVVVTLIMIAIVRNLRMGLAMAGINLSCVIIVLGSMGWIGIVLDPFTILIGAIAIGILDDDTIHFVVSALKSMSGGARLREAIDDTFQGAGRAMGLQTLVLIVAFIVYSLSSVASLSTFGLVTATTMLVGLVAEYFVTPAVIILLSRKGDEA